MKMIAKRLKSNLKMINISEIRCTIFVYFFIKGLAKKPIIKKKSMVLVVERKGLNITLLKAMLKLIYPKKTERVIITSLVTERAVIVSLMVQISLQIKNLLIKISQREEKNKTFLI